MPKRVIGPVGAGLINIPRNARRALSSIGDRSSAETESGIRRGLRSGPVSPATRVLRCLLSPLSPFLETILMFAYTGLRNPIIDFTRFTTATRQVSVAGQSIEKKATIHVMAAVRPNNATSLDDSAKLCNSLCDLLQIIDGASAPCETRSCDM